MPTPKAVSKVIDGDARPEIQEARAHHDALHPSGKHQEGHEHFEAEGALVTNHEIPLLLETQAAGGFTPQRRAEIVAERLNEMVHEHSLEAEHIVVHMKNGIPTVYYSHAGESKKAGHLIATVDRKTAAQFGLKNNAGKLAFWWRDVLRDHALIIAGEPPLYTAPYTQALQRLYAACQQEKKGIPSHDAFEKALKRLSVSERDSLQSLYNRVPANYRPQPDEIHSGGHASKPIHGESKEKAHDEHPHE